MLNTKRGEKKQGYLNIVNSNEKIPVTEIYGYEGDYTVVILGGIHAGEYVGIEAAIKLANELEPNKITGRVIIVNPININGFYAKVQHINPIDNKNCNRAFPGDENGTLTDKIGYTLVRDVFSEADFVLDLHGGDLHEDLVPFAMYATNCSKEVSDIAKDAALSLNVKYVSGMDFPQTAIGMAGSMGIPSVISFVGGCGNVIKSHIDKYCMGVKSLLTSLGVYKGRKIKTYINEFQKLNIFYANNSGRWLPYVKPGQKVIRGQLIGEIKDFYDNILEQFYANDDAVVLCVINSLAINIGDSVYELDR